MPPTIGDVRIAMLFVDFADAPGENSPQSIAAAYVPYVTEWYERVSYGRLLLSVQPVQRWLRLPRTLTAYRGDGFDGAFEAAVAAVEGELDFSGFAAVYLILPRAAGPLASTIVDHEPHAVGGAAIRSGSGSRRTRSTSRARTSSSTRRGTCSVSPISTASATAPRPCTAGT